MTALNKVKASSLRRAAALHRAPGGHDRGHQGEVHFHAQPHRVRSERHQCVNGEDPHQRGVFARAEMWTQEHAYFMQSAVDNVMWPIVWSAAYDEASARGESEKDAIRWADSVIRTTQGSATGGRRALRDGQPMGQAVLPVCRLLWHAGQHVGVRAGQHPRAGPGAGEGRRQGADDRPVRRGFCPSGSLRPSPSPCEAVQKTMTTMVISTTGWRPCLAGARSAAPRR